MAEQDSEVVETKAQHTPGPWRWELNLKGKHVSLNGGKPRFDLTVLDCERWGMGSARLRLLERSGSGMMLMAPCEQFAAQVPGREHHADWFQTLNHPDANLIAAAPELLAACKALDDYQRLYESNTYDRMPGNEFYSGKAMEIVAAARAAITKAVGR